MIIHGFIFKEEIKADVYGVIPRVELINKVQSVGKIKTSGRIDTGKKNDSSSAFDSMLAYEQGRKNKVKFEDMPVSINPDTMDGKMNYYNNKAMEAYFCMTFSTTDLKG